MITARRLLLATVLALTALPAAAQANRTGPDYISSDNVELVDRIKTIGDGVGGRIILDGKYLVVTSTKSLDIFDIHTDPEHPKQVNTCLPGVPLCAGNMDIEFENEEVPTNGKILGISGDTFCVVPGPPTAAAQNCITLWDITDLSNPKIIKTVENAGDHTAACVLDCQYFMGSEGTVIDARVPANAEKIGDWRTALPGGRGYFKASCHHLREIVPGIVLGSCQPMILMSIRAEDGGSPLKPVVLATGTNSDERFIHSSRWPNNGTDKFMLSGGETNAQPQCDDTVGAFMVWDASAVGRAAKPNVGAQFKLVDEVRPVNGSYVDGHSPVNGLGCSVHWFTEHPTFKNGGLVALAEYENGTRLLQITPAGKIVEQGFFLPLGGSTSSPFWHPNGKVIYNIDYARGIDVLRYTGPTYVPDQAGAVTPEPGTTPGTGGAAPGTSGAAACKSGAGFASVAAKGSGSGVRIATKRLQQRAFDVSLFQLSAGRRVIDNKLRGRRSGDGLLKPKGATDGFYLLRLRMKLADGGTDTRRLTLLRSRGRFRVVKDFHQRTDCGVLRTFKLSSAVFGGSRNVPLGIAYRLARGAQKVTVKVTVGSRTVKTFTGGGSAARTYRFSVPAGLVRRGAQVKVTATISTGSPTTPQVLYAKRI